MPYIAIKLSAYEGEESHKGTFDTEQDAWDYIGKHCVCKMCREELDRGYIEYPIPDSDRVDRIEVGDPALTACGLLYVVIEEDDLAGCHTMDDIMDVAFGEPIYETAEAKAERFERQLERDRRR